MKTLFKLSVSAQITSAVLMLGCLATSHPVHGQTNAGKPATTYTNKTFFHLPIQIDRQARSAVREVILYVKKGAGPWVKQQVAGAMQKHFTYQVPGEGEYWFNVVTVDKFGRANPANVNNEPPALVVHVDSTPPTVKIAPQTLGGGQTGLRCTIRDKNPDYQSLSLSYRGDNQVWRKMSRVAGSQGLFHLPNVPVLNGTVRYTVMDRAGNVHTQEVILREKQNDSPVAAQPPKMPLLPSSKKPSPATVMSPPASNGGAPQAPNQDIIQTSAESSVNHHSNNSGVKEPRLPSLPSEPMVESPLANTTNNYQPADGSQGHQLINTTNANVDYRIDQVGPSGVSKVDVWIKGESASMWQRVGTDVDLKSPVQINLPHEGLFGVRLSVTNGNGFGGKPPRPNDEPSFWIEVDTTSPILQIKEIGPVTNGNSIDIHWTASDKNLGPTPVNLMYASSPDGPWLPIAQNVKNSGHHRWQFPQNIGSKIYLRIEVTDRAENTAEIETREPITLDLTEPQAQVVGVTGVRAVSDPPSAGNQ